MGVQTDARAATATLLAVAVVFTLLNAAKPLTIDDTVYYYFARQIAEHPADPYGFEIFWDARPRPALQQIAPLLQLYWWAAALAVVGDAPVLWKLWLFPFALILAHSLYGLFRRVAPGLERPLLWMTAFSPALLPNFNLILDVPALAVGLFALERF